MTANHVVLRFGVLLLSVVSCSNGETSASDGAGAADAFPGGTGGQSASTGGRSSGTGGMDRGGSGAAEAGGRGAAGGAPSLGGGSGGAGAGGGGAGGGGAASGAGSGGVGAGGAVGGTGGQPQEGPRTEFSTDPAEFFGDSRCTALDAIVCEGFEGGTVPLGDVWEQSSWPPPGSAGEPQLRVDAAHVARGSGALHLTVDDGSEAYLLTRVPFPATGNAFYGRAFFFVQSPIPEHDYTIHWNLVEAVGPDSQNGEVYTSKIRYGGTYNPFVDNYIFNVEAQPRPAGFNEFAVGDGHPLERDEWVCVEWYLGDGPEGRLWRNGVESPELHVGSPVDGIDYDMPPFEAVKIGWAIYQQVDVPFEVWIDEIALDDERIGCQR